jgi:DNA-binding GntR family transcriptional regulator
MPPARPGRPVDYACSGAPLDNGAVSALSTETQPSSHGQRRQAVVQSILADIFHGRIQAGQHLVTQKLAERFGVSHTPIREALINLAGMGIVDLLPNRGAVVRSVRAREVREVCQVRRLLECQATRSACGRIARALLEELARDLRQLIAATTLPIHTFIEQARAIDSRLHDLIAASCGNSFLAQELGRLKILFRAFRDMSYNHHIAQNDYPRLADEAREHLSIVEALLAGDARAAARAMALHIRSGIRVWSQAMPASVEN